VPRREIDVTDPLVVFEGVSMRYTRRGAAPRFALREVEMTVPAGETVSIMGRSGSGKSTLLNLAAGIDVPSAGRVRTLGRDLAALSDAERTALRRDGIGFVFQFFHLLSHLGVLENVALPAWIAGEDRATWEPRARELLQRVGLGDRAADPIEALSGGEMQRVAICRALLRRPRLVLADEPTGNLDDDNGRVVADLMFEMVRDEGVTLIFVTHDPDLAALAGARWSLHSGVLEAG
jgi:predicted ABC-type transport system involved in lysophospholipase L1 biosynthesis ATPase subunit